MRFSLFLLWLLACLHVHAQDFQLIKYRVKDGLPTDVVKAVMEDSLGFLWVATDEGLAKFDGTRFTSYKGALHSQYAKAFLKTKQQRIFLIGDLDLVEIKNQVDTALVTSVRSGTRNPTDSALWYPKSIYEDDEETLWIGEPQSVARVTDHSVKRFAFGKEDQTPEFLRSFLFFEDQRKSLFCVSYFGRVYQYDPTKEVFTRIQQSFPTDIKDLKIIDQTIWIAASEGLYRAVLNDSGGFSTPEKKMTVDGISCMQRINTTHLFIGTNSKKQYLLDLTENKLSLLPYEISDVNSAFVSKNNDLWLASSEGLILLQENLFKILKAQDQATFIESIAEDSSRQTIYYTTILNLFSSKIVHGKPEQQKIILNIPRGYYQSMQMSRNGLWASNRFSILLLRDEKVYRTWDFENEGRFVFDLFLDRHENLWLSQDGNRKVVSITKDLITKRYSVPLAKESNINAIRGDETGVLGASTGVNTYLYHLTYGDSVFKNISVPVNFSVQGDFSIADMVVNNGIVWLASSEGLLKYDYKTIERVDLGDQHTELAVKTVANLKPGEILFNNSLGMIRYQISTGDWWLYNEGNGLPSNTISARGIFVGSQNRVWVGTSMGLSYASSSIVVNSKSTTPLFTHAIVNGKSKLPANDMHIPYKSFLNLVISANTYPESKVNLQYRFSNNGERWNTIKGSQLSISDLPAGAYSIEIRAKKTGGFNWSDIREFSFIVDKPFWQENWFVAFVIMVLSIVGVASYQTARGINKRRRHELEKLLVEVKERNEEIQAQSEELTESHQTLNLLNAELGEQKEELLRQAEELMNANLAQNKLYQALAEKNEEIQAQSEELTESNQTISQLNTDLEKRVEEKSRDLLRTNEELSKYNSDLLQFSYSVSHNLRGPVARLLGLSTLMAGANDISELKSMVGMVQGSSMELDTVLRDLTNIIDMRNNVSNIREKVFFIDEWNRSSSMLREQIKSEFQINADFSAAPFIYTVRGLLQSILYNLLSNAIKYHSPDRGLTLQVRTWTTGNDTFLEVKDNGLGFDLATQRDKIFKLYKRFHTHVPGRGLGLYLVKTQTELLNGSITIESEINKGTTFCLTLPTPESIERQVFFDTETAQLYYDANINNTVIIWKKEITPESYRLTFETVLRTVRTYNSPGWIADLRNQGVVRPEEQTWFGTKVLSEAVKSGLKRIGAIGFYEPKRQEYYKFMVAQAAQFGIELQDFRSLEDATDWMRDSLKGTPKVQS